MFSKIKYTEAILSASTRKALWFQFTKVLSTVSKMEIYWDIYYNFRHTTVPYLSLGSSALAGNVMRSVVSVRPPFPTDL